MAKTTVEVVFKGQDQVSPPVKKIEGTLNKLKSVASQTGKLMEDKFGTKVPKSFQDVAIAVGAAYLAFQKLKSIGTNLINAYDAQTQAETKLSAAIKATGNQIAFSNNQLKKMAVEMSNLTVYGDEAVITAQGLFTTFTKIGHEVFPQALKAAADMSAMFGQDLQQSAIQLGTALNDPIAGIGRLKRIGISFTEDQKKSIKQFVEQNDIMSAQGVILKELSAEFGGVAEAVGQSSVGSYKRLINAIGDFKEVAGKALLESLQPLFEKIREFLAFLESNVSIFADVGNAIAFFGSIIIDVLKFIIQFRELILALIVTIKVLPIILGVVSIAMKTFGATSTAALGPIGLIIGAVIALTAAIVTLVNRTKQMEAELNNLEAESSRSFDLVKDAQKGMLDNLADYNEAQDIVTKKISDIRVAMRKNGSEHRQVYSSMLKREEEVLASINKNIQLEKDRALIAGASAGILSDYSEYAKAIDAQSAKLEELYIKKESLEGVEKKLVNSFIYEQNKVLDKIKERQAAAYLETDEYKKLMEERKTIEEEYANKVFELSASRVEILAKEESKVLSEARKIGANLVDIKKYFSKQRTKIVEDEIAKEIEIYTKFIEDRKAKEKSIYDFLILWSNKSGANRLDIIKRERDETLKSADDMLEALKKVYGAGTIEGVQKGEILDIPNIKEIENLVSAYSSAISNIKSEYTDKLKSAQEEINRLQQLGGEKGLELYSKMLNVSEELADPIEKQTAAIQLQINSLKELRNLLPSDVSVLTDFQKEVTENIPKLLKQLEEKLSEIADQPLVELAQKVADISKRFKDPVELAIEAIGKDLEEVKKYSKMLDDKKKLYKTEQEFLSKYGTQVQATDKLLKDLENELNNARTEMLKSNKLTSFWDVLVSDLTDTFTKFRSAAESKFASVAGKDVSQLSASERDEALGVGVASAGLGALANIALSLVDYFVGLITSTAAWKDLMDQFNTTLSNVMEFAIVPLIKAIKPLLTVVIALVSVIANLLVPIFNMLGLFIQSIMPVFFLLGQIIIKVVEILIKLLAPVLSILVIVISALLPVFDVLIIVLDILSGVISALNPLFKVLEVTIKLALVPMVTMISIFEWLYAVLYNFGKFIGNVVTNLFDSSKWTQGFKNANIGDILANNLQSLMKTPSTGDFSTVGGLDTLPAFTSDLVFGGENDTQFETATNGGIFGGGTTVKQVPNININNYFQGPFVGTQNADQLGQFMVVSIEDFLRNGGRASWLEA